MKKKILISVSISLSIVVLILAYLLLSTPLPNQKDNGFTRKWIAQNISPLHENTFSLPLIRICGSTKNYLFFSSVNPRWVLMTTMDLKPKDTLIFNIEPTEKLLTNSINVDSPNVYIYANNISYLISGNTTTRQVDTLHLLTPVFTRVVRISPSLLIIRGLDTSRTKQEFKQINSKNGQVGNLATILEDRHDGGFSTDGFLSYDNLTKRMLYVQLYQNRFFCIDTNLNVIYTGRTIDTSNTNLVSIKPVKSDNEVKLMPSSPRQQVNNESFTNNGYLFIVSNLRADNESITDFNKNTTIDIYQIENGNYFSSLRIPNVQGKKILSAHMNNDTLIVLYKGGHIATFNVKLPPALKTFQTARK